MGDLLRPLPGCLVGSWRGISFHIPDITTPAGRRLISIDLPGADVTIHEDLGIANAPIRVTGLVVGDDATAEAAALRSACERPGPGVLVHPWFGPMMVILSEPAEITFEASKLRCFVFRATFLRWAPAGSGPGATLALIASAAADLTSVALSLLDVADVLVGGAIGEILSATVDVGLDLMMATAAGADLATVIGGAILDGVDLLTATSAVEDAIGAATWITSFVSAIAAAGAPPPTPAIGAGPARRAAEASVDPWSTVVGLLAFAEASADTGAGGDGEALVRAGLASATVAAIATPLAAVSWESRQQAEAARAQISSSITAIARTLVASPRASADGAAARQATWRALARLRRRIHEDLDDRIGRLPSVATLTPPTRTNAWIVAHYVAGDDPKAVRSAFEDIVRRNRIANPARLPDGAIEVLPVRTTR